MYKISLRSGEFLVLSNKHGIGFFFYIYNLHVITLYVLHFVHCCRPKCDLLLFTCTVDSFLIVNRTNFRIFNCIPSTDSIIRLTKHSCSLIHQNRKNLKFVKQSLNESILNQTMNIYIMYIHDIQEWII